MPAALAATSIVLPATRAAMNCCCLTESSYSSVELPFSVIYCHLSFLVERQRFERCTMDKAFETQFHLLGDNFSQLLSYVYGTHVHQTELHFLFTVSVYHSATLQDYGAASSSISVPWD